MAITQYDKSGNQVSVDDFTELWADGDYRRVASDIIDGYHVSTVWLGAAHGQDTRKRPLIFETMVFGDGQYKDQTYRWATEAEALQGHKVICEAIYKESSPRRQLRKQKPSMIARLGFSVMKGLGRGNERDES